MNCAEATALLSAHADGETGGLRGYSIRRHLRACRSCASRHEELLAQRAQIRAEVQRHSAPPELRARVLATIDAVRAYATLGEICSALRDVYGVYEEPAF